VSPFLLLFFKNTGIKPTYYIEQLTNTLSTLNKKAYRNSEFRYKRVFFLAIKFKFEVENINTKIKKKMKLNKEKKANKKFDLQKNEGS
jgi:hypothetical protein